MANDHHALYTGRRRRSDLDANSVGIEGWLLKLLRGILGYDDLNATDSIELGDRVFKLTHRACGKAVPLLLATRDFELDKSDPSFGVEERRHAPHALMQEYLNAEDDSLWGIVSNGSKLRILRDNPSLTRPAYIEADLDLLFEDGLYSDFATFWLAAHSSRLTPREGKPSNCIIESWRNEAIETGERARENLRDGVTQALRQLGNGFLLHSDNVALRARIKDGSLSAAEYFKQLLELVYRILFVCAAEERDLLHSPDATDQQRAVYSDGYSIARLRERSLRRRHYDHHRDLWDGLRISFRSLAHGTRNLGLPALGGLFRDEYCADLVHAAIANKDLLEAVRALTFLQSGNSLTRVNYRDMGVEELGSVYESLLDLQPDVRVDTNGYKFAFFGENSASTKGSQRKLTGTYYTPAELVNQLIKSTLEPVLKTTIDENPENPRNAILNLKVLDPACGSGHFLLAAARRIALEITRLDSADDTSDELTRQQALREVVQHCIYGVDRNPLAVELCKASLWIDTINPGKPLTFLEPHIQQGDSLVGILDPAIIADGIPKDAFKPLTGDSKSVCQSIARQNATDGKTVQDSLFDAAYLQEIAARRAEIGDLTEETLDQIESKRAAWRESHGDKKRKHEELFANMFVGAYFVKKTLDNAEKVPQTRDINRLINGIDLRPGVEKAVKRLAKQHSFFHWHIAFADIMERGGFDVVLGNPPWERIKIQEKEFFETRSQEISAAPNKASRDRLIEGLAREEALPHEKFLYNEFKTAKRSSDATSMFLRTGGRYPLTGVGDINTYAVFAETMLELTGPGGRAGMIVPTEIVTGFTTREFYSSITDKERLVSLLDFENRQAIFRGIDRRIRFCLLTLCGNGTEFKKPLFSFYLHDSEEARDSKRQYRLTKSDLTLFSPNTRSSPTFRSRQDMEIARKMYLRAGVLWREGCEDFPEENPWGIKFFSMFHMANDSELFRTRDEMENDGFILQGNVFRNDAETYFPLYESKLFHQFDHRFATFGGEAQEALLKGNARPLTAAEKRDISMVVIPRYWVHEKEVLSRVDKINRIESQQIMTADSRQPTADSRQPTADSRQPTADSRQPTADSRQPTADSRQPTADSRQPTADSRQPTADSRQPTADSLFRNQYPRTTYSFLAIRMISNATNIRSSIVAAFHQVAMSDTGTGILIGVLPSETSCALQTVAPQSSPTLVE